MAAEAIATGVASNIISSSIKKAATKARYVFSFNNFVETLENEKQKLMAKECSIKEDIERAQWSTETVDAEVLNWLKDAEKLQTEVDELQNKIRMHNAAPCCPNCIQRYRLGRSMAKKIEKLTQQISNCKFKKFSRLATLQGMEYYSSEGFVSFESRKHAYDEIVEALKDEGIRRIGVHGMGGCGKTTLVKEVGKEVEKLRLFEKVLIVVVPNPPDIKKIQASIAGSLGLKFEVEENELERSRRLSMALNNRGKILIILDDVWKKLNFEDIGIPSSCYILLTTRESSICSAMGCRRVISLEVLDDVESWILFQKHAGISDDKIDTFKDVGKTIANECRGLPVAIAVVASSLRDKELHHWEVALDKLKDYRQGDIEPALEDIYKCLKISYDNLRREGDKSLFLLCSIYPEDFEIPIEELTRNAMGLGLFGKVESNEKTRKQVSVAVDNLVDSCLLLKGDTKNTIKMHDLVHDVALHLAKIENKKIIVIERSKKELEEHLISNDSQIRYLWWDMDKFPNQFNCPKLVFMGITTYLENQVEVPEEFFNRKKKLKVLALANEAYKDPILQLSKSIQSLTNLCCLSLTGWQLGDISFVGRLVKIETLILYSCSFHELPDGLANLKNLRLLDMVDCIALKNPYEVIKRCLQLEELYCVRNIYPKWEDRGENIVEFSGKLERYHVEIGPSHEELDDIDYSIKRYLSIKDYDTHFSIAIVDALIRRAEVVSLGGIHRGCTSIIPGFVQKIGEGMNELTKLIAHDSDKLECVADMTRSFYQYGTALSNLTHLTISRLQKLEKLFLGQPHHGIFQKLEELHISECNQLKHLIANEAREIVSDCDNPRDYNSVFPKLKLIAIRKCQELEYLMPASFLKGLLKLENLDIKGASQLKYLFSQSNLEDEGQLCNQNQNEFHIIKLEALKCLTLEDMPNVISICPKNYYPIWPSLDSLLLRNCPQLKSLFDDLEFRQQDHTMTKAGIVFSNLTKIKIIGLNCLETLFLGTTHLAAFEKLEKISISYCSQLKHLVPNDHENNTYSDGSKPKSYNSFFPKLKEISIDYCQQLEYLMPVSFTGGMVQLEVLEIASAYQLKYAFGHSNYEAQDMSCNRYLKGPNLMKLQALKILKLQYVPNIVGICPENYYPVFPSLDSMKLEGCPQLNIMLDKLEFRRLDHTIKKNGIFCNLTKLNFIELDWLETLFFGTLHPGGFEKLEEISIQRCNHLKHLIANDVEKITSYGKSSWSYNSIFPKLKEITIFFCPELEYLMPISFAMGMLQLEKVDIHDASQLNYLFGSSNHKAGDHLVNQNLNELNIVNLKSLKRLSLLDLPNITNICPETYYPIWSSSYSLLLEMCPRLNIKPIKNCTVDLELRQQNHSITKELGAAMVLNVQNLRSLSVFYDNEVDGLFHLQGLPMDGQQVTASLINLHLKFLPELKYIWSGPKQFLSLQNLRSLKIKNCKKLEVVFSTSILRSLNQLKMLQIIECQELHQIFEEDEENKDQSNCHSGQVHLPKLTTLIVQQCDKLKHLFSFTTSFELPKLKFLIIKEAYELEEVIACANDDRKEKMQVNFPELEHVVLVQLPKLCEIYQGFELEIVKYRVVHHCAKLPLRSSDTLENMEEIYQDYDSEDDDEDEDEDEVEDEDEDEAEDEDGDDDDEQDEAAEIIHDIICNLLYTRSNEIQNENATSEIHSQHQIDQAALENELHASKDDANQTIQGSESQNSQNDDCIKSKVFTPEQKGSLIASSNLTQSISEQEKEFVGTVLDQKIPVITNSTYEPELASRLNHSHGAGWQIPLRTTTSISIKEKEQESDQENHKSKETVIAPLSVYLEASNKGNVEEGPAFDYVNLAHVKSTSSPQPGLPQEKEDHYEGHGNDSRNKHHQEKIGSLSGLCTSMPEAQSKAMQSEDKSCNWGKFLTLSLFSGPQMVEESPPKKTTYHHIVPEKLDSDVGIIGETINKSVQKIPVSAKPEEKASSIEFTSSQVSFSTKVPPAIFTPSPSSQHFSNTPNAEGDIAGGFDLNKPLNEFFEDIEQKIQVLNTSSNDSKFTTSSSPRPLPVPVRITPSVELVDEQPMSRASLKDQQEAIDETEIHFQTSEESNRMKKTVQASDEEGPKTEKIEITHIYFDLEPRNPSPESLLLPQNPSPQIINEPAKEFDGEVLNLKIPTIATSNDSELTMETSPCTLAIPLHTTPSASAIRETMEASDEEGPQSVEIEIEPVLTDLESRNLSSGPLVQGINPSLQRIKGSIEEFPTMGDAKILTSTQSKATRSVPSKLLGQSWVSQTQNYTSEDVMEDLINPEKFKDVDLFALLQSMEEDSNTQAPILSFSKIAAKSLTGEDALADIEVSLKVPLKDIASTENASLSLQNALNFLSSHSFKDDTMSYGLKAAIDSLHQNLPSMLSSFKQASATISRYTLLEDKEKSMKEELPRRKESAVTLFDKISKIEMSMAEIQQKEASLKEQINRLQNELNNTERRKKECEAELSSLQEQKKKRVAETIEFKKVFENVKEDKFQMIEDHKKALEELFEVNNKWSTLCSQFEQNHSATSSLSYT